MIFSAPNIYAEWRERSGLVPRLREDSAIPPERLLVYNVKEGWEPLCRFLNVPVPEGPFPHLNDREEFQRRARQAAPTTGRSRIYATHY